MKPRKFSSKYQLEFSQPFIRKIHDELQRKVRNKSCCGRALVNARMYTKKVK
jgi:hypothetical protein